MKYLLQKHGLWYRPQSCGYTSSITAAGLFDAEYALRHSKGTHSEVAAIPVSDLTIYHKQELEQAILNSQYILDAINSVQS